MDNVEKSSRQHASEENNRGPKTKLMPTRFRCQFNKCVFVCINVTEWFQKHNTESENEEEPKYLRNFHINNIVAIYRHCITCIIRMERENARAHKYTKSFTNLCCHCWCSNAFSAYWYSLRTMKRIQCNMQIYMYMHTYTYMKTIHWTWKWMTDWMTTNWCIMHRFTLWCIV